MVCRSPTGFDMPGKISMKCIIHTEKTYISICKIMKISARKIQRMHFRAPRPSGPQTPGRKGRSLYERLHRMRCVRLPGHPVSSNAHFGHPTIQILARSLDERIFIISSYSQSALQAIWDRDWTQPLVLKIL